MRNIIFSISITGHRLEYIHHIYDVCRQKIDNDYIFSLPSTFEDVQSLFNWEIAENIRFDFLADGDLKNYLEAKDKGSFICELLNKVCIRNNTYKVFTIDLAAFPYNSKKFLNKGIELKGIVYGIFFYEIKKLNLLRKIHSFYKQIRFIHCRNFKAILLLNDKDAPKWMNALFLTKKCKYIPDPFIQLPTSTIKIREKYMIPMDHIIISHFGGLTRRKGTLLILEAIKLMNEDELQKYVFIFAGRVYDDIRDEFYQIYEDVKKKANIIIEDTFCTYDYLASLSRDSDLILLPYLLTTRSSGVIGYASQYYTPVAVPNDGFIGYLVRKYHIGYLLNKCNPESISNFLKEKKTFSKQIDNTYCISHSTIDFQKYLNNHL